MKKIYIFLIILCFTLFSCKQEPQEYVMLNIEGATLNEIEISFNVKYRWLTANNGDVITGNLLFSTLKNIEVKPDDYEINIHSVENLEESKATYFDLIEKSTN